jgi:phage protein D
VVDCGRILSWLELEWCGRSRLLEGRKCDGAQALTKTDGDREMVSKKMARCECGRQMADSRNSGWVIEKQQDADAESKADVSWRTGNPTRAGGGRGLRRMAGRERSANRRYGAKCKKQRKDAQDEDESGRESGRRRRMGCGVRWMGIRVEFEMGLDG